MAHDFREGPRDRRKFSRPIRELVRPAEPSRVVRLPFGGHAKAESVRCFGLRRCFHWEKESNTEITEGTESTEKKGTILCRASD